MRCCELYLRFADYNELNVLCALTQIVYVLWMRHPSATNYVVFYIQNHRHFCRDREVRGEEGRGEKRGCLLKRRGEARREKMLENKNEKA